MASIRSLALPYEATTGGSEGGTANLARNAILLGQAMLMHNHEKVESRVSPIRSFCLCREARGRQATTEVNRFTRLSDSLLGLHRTT